MGNATSAATKKISPLVVAAERGRRAILAEKANSATLGTGARLARKGSVNLVRTLSDKQLNKIDASTGGGKRRKIKSKKRTKRRRKNHTKNNHTKKNHTKKNRTKKNRTKKNRTRKRR